MLSAYETSLGQNHPLAAGVLFNLAMLLRITGTPKEALSLLKRSAGIYLAQMFETGYEPPNLNLVLSAYAEVLRLDFGLDRQMSIARSYG